MSGPPVERTDLTRWNRAGLSRFTYVDANAVTLLDRLREEILLRFGGAWDPASPDATNLLERYAAAPHGDSGWELLRALARAAHVVTAHTDAYANETFLRTATQPEFLRRLVALLDYHPTPSSSASTTLSFQTTSTAHDPIKVPAGTQVRFQPPDAAPVVFETLLPLDASPTLNALRPVGASANPHALSDTFTLAKDIPVVLGDPIVIEEGTHVACARVTAIARDAQKRPRITVSPAPSGFTVGGATVHTDPRDRMSTTGPMTAATPSGRQLHTRTTTAGLRAGDVIWISTPAGLKYVNLTDVQPFGVTVEHDPGSLVLSATIGPSLPLKVLSANGPVLQLDGDWMSLDQKTVGVSAQALYMIVLMMQGASFAQTSEVDLRPPAVNPTDLVTRVVDGVTAYDAVVMGKVRTHSTLELQTAPGFANGAQVAWIFIRPDTSAASAIHLEGPLDDGAGALPHTIATTAPARTERSDWVAMADSGQLVAGRASAVSTQGNTGSISVEAWTGGGAFYPATTTVYGHFSGTSRILDWEVNDTLVGSTATLSLDAVPPALVPGRPVIVENTATQSASSTAAGNAPAVATRVLSVTRADAGATGPASVTFADPVPAEATLSSLFVRGNAVLAGHGKRMPPVVIGSGAADKVNQRFVIIASDASTVPDPSFPSGVRLDLDVTVQDRHWVQVPDLRDAEPDAFAYTADFDEDGDVVVHGGDGFHGRRFPSGRDNVVAGWRVGSGLNGDVAPGSLHDLVRPIAGIDSVAQPIAASGGGSGDSAEAIRANAARGILALGRAVSLADFEALATARADVWQARARHRPGGLRGASVDLVVVPAGAGALGSAQQHQIEATLIAAAPPGMSVAVRGHRSVPLVLDVTIAVRSEAFDPELIRRLTLAAIDARFSAEVRLLGERITREEVVLVAESIEGVENATCSIGQATADAVAADRDAVVRDGENAIRMVRAAPDELIAVDGDHPSVSVVPVEYQL